MTVITIVLLFSFFVLFYLPAIQEQYLLSNFNKEVQNHANTVALGVKIAMTEQNFEGVKTAMDFVKKDPQLVYVSLLQVDTSWNETHTKFTVKKTVFRTYPEDEKINLDATSDDSTVVKRAAFSTPMMKGEILLAASTSEIIQSKKQIRITSLLFSFLVFTIGIVIGFGLARNISVPVLELRDAATKVGHGDLTQRVVSKSRDEIGELGIAFNKMVTDLSKARQEVEERTNELILEKKKSDDLLIDLQKTLTDLEETQEQLIRQEKLASIGQLTKGLVDRLLNPLNYINNFAAISKDFLKESKELMATEKYASDETINADLIPLLNMAQANTEKINEHGLSLSRIVRSMEKLLQSKSNNFIKTNINAFIENTLIKHKNENQLNYQGLPLELVTDLDSRNCSIKILPTEMHTVMSSLLNNALYSLHEKYTLHPDFKPRITIKTSFLEHAVEMRIEDNGKGIAENERKQLFSPFFTTKPTSKGTGLGLFISQDIVRTHHGTIAVDSQEGAYTAFIIQLPVC
ncbi:sensor histidine kinase [Spirosoma koreense]